MYWRLRIVIRCKFNSGIPRKLMHRLAVQVLLPRDGSLQIDVWAGSGAN